ncbi:MAG: 50S ribosomal protein L6 [Proteobacteria bacterium]|nr:50S ribosomal protein L6 [Pseudomonadota bacterium]MBU1452812.1 50S ribosomal protein L6 [Pseudomonadota bacterium]MBU2467363.1 50S ribosomal protein L6 [Pseudomonadota bacterium]MBU2518027.1 50S ribosomal protein L6 [Pseudomonadota bacterium]
MSRVGKQPVALPSGVEVAIDDMKIEVKGPKGVLSRELHPLVVVSQEDAKLTVTPADNSLQARGLWGLFRTLIDNMVIGVSKGFTRVLEINGVGYRAEAAGDTLKLTLGFSHPVEFKLPEGISASVEKNTIITMSGIDKELLGQTAATIRAFRPPEPYKGKGIKYAEETIRRKVGKAGVK